MSISIDTSELDAFARAISGAQPIVREEMLRGMTRSVLMVERTWKTDAPVITGTYRRGITHTVIAAGGNIKAEVGTNVPYAMALEEGRSAVTILPRNAKVLVFQIGGVTVFAREVHQPARPGRHYGAAALQRNTAAILREFSDVVPQRVAARLGL